MHLVEAQGRWQQPRADLEAQVLRHILGCRVEGNAGDAERVTAIDMHTVGVVRPQQHSVIPVLFKPIAERGLDDAEVDHPADRVERPADMEVHAVVVPVQVRALVFVPDNSMPGRKVVISGGCDVAPNGRRR